MKRLLLLTAIVMAFFGAVNAQNLLVNGDLEAGLSNAFDDWIGYSVDAVRQELTYPITGRSCRLASLNSGVWFTQDVSVEAGQTYDISFTGRIQDSHAASGTVTNTDHTLVCRIQADGVWTEVATTTSPADETVTGTFTVPAGITMVKFQMTKANGIAYFDDLSMVKSTSTSVEDEFAPKTSVYPNPTNGLTQISSVEVINSYSVFNSTGQLLKIVAANQTAVQVDMSAYAKGLYIISATDVKGSVQVIKVYKK